MPPASSPQQSQQPLASPVPPIPPPLWPRRIKPPDPFAGRPSDVVISEIAYALVEYYVDRLFLLDDTRLVYFDRQGREIGVTVDHLDGLLRACVLMEQSPRRFSDVDLRTIRVLYATRNEWAPPLNARIPSPFLAANGELITEYGYHAATGTFCTYNTALDGELPEIEYGSDAMFDVLQKLVAWFPMQEASAIAHTLGMYLLPLVRTAIAGPTPAHLIVAPQRNMGKSELAESVLIAGYGLKPGQDKPTATPEKKDAYQIEALLYSRPDYLYFDNRRTNSLLGGPEFHGLLTNTGLHSRVVGSGVGTSVKIRCMWIFTGNFIDLDDEMARRSVEIYFSPESIARCMKLWSDPTQEKTVSFVRRNRALVLGTLLSIIKAWMAAGRPPPKRLHAERTYEDWSLVVGGIVDFLSDTFTDMADGWLDPARRPVGAETKAWTRAFALWSVNGDERSWLTSSDVMKHLERLDVRDDIVDRPVPALLGKKLAKYADSGVEVVPGVTLTSMWDPHAKAYKYRPEGGA